MRCNDLLRPTAHSATRYPGCQLDLEQEGTTLRACPREGRAQREKIIMTGSMAFRSESGPLAAHIFGTRPGWLSAGVRLVSAIEVRALALISELLHMRRPPLVLSLLLPALLPFPHFPCLSGRLLHSTARPRQSPPSFVSTFSTSVFSSIKPPPAAL